MRAGIVSTRYLLFRACGCGQEIGQVDSHSTLKASFTKGTVDQVLLVWFGLDGNVAKAEVLPCILTRPLPRLSFRPKMQRKTSSKKRLYAKR